MTEKPVPSSLSRSRRLGETLAVALILVLGARSARADEWEGTWAADCHDKNALVELSRSQFGLGIIEMECKPVGFRKIGSRYTVDLSCDGEGGAQRMRAQLEVRNDTLTISGIPARLGTLHRCTADK